MVIRFSILACIKMTTKPPKKYDSTLLTQQIKQWGIELGFQQIGITDTNVSQAHQHLKNWLAKGYHADMNYMQQHAELREHPEKLLPGTIRVITARIDYLPPNAPSQELHNNQNLANISHYAWGKDYHKLIRKRLGKLAIKIADAVGEDIETCIFRSFADSAPVLERALAEKSGLGWIGKHTCLINRQAGSWFFLGELYTNLELVTDKSVSNHCGTCSACIDVCPTKAIVAPYQLDARRCISYLTIENKGPIPEEFRKLLGNHVFGCDDCQLVCPWNRFAKFTKEEAFHPRHNLNNSNLIELFSWSEQQFKENTQGSAIRRAGYIGWLRNIAVALGNAPKNDEIVAALQKRLQHPSELVREHVAWALAQ